MANAPIDPHTHPKQPGLLGAGAFASPLGAKSQPKPLKPLKRAPQPVVITCDPVGSAVNFTANCMVVEDPKARSATGELVLVQKSSSFKSEFFRVNRSGVNHYVSVVTKADPGSVNWETCTIFHHPSANQHRHGISDNNYDPPATPWQEIRDSYVLHMGAQHTARVATPLIIPLIRFGAWQSANGNNFIFGSHAHETLTLLLRKASGNATLDVSSISTASFSNGIQSQAQTLPRFRAGFIAFATDYDSAIAAKGTLNLGPTARMQVRRYSQHGDPKTHETVEFLLPFKIWPDIDYLNRNPRKPLIRPKGMSAHDFSLMQLFWTHWRMTASCHWHAMG